MNNRIREKAILAVADAHDHPRTPPVPLDDIFGDYASDVFTPDAMKALLSKASFAKFLRTARDGEPLDPEIADDVASAMRRWAIARGATHYTHWFQPLTGSTAEKHDALFEPDAAQHPIVKFSGKNLIVGEPDASSFPSGGLRSTFEARGYTAWDPTSPAFLRRVGNTVTLCIPTAFCSWNGEALDQKTPLLRSIQALSAAVHRLMKAFRADRPGARVSVSLGIEQEYFLIDRRFAFARPDIVQTGRTLFGAPPPKHQQLEDHYFGTISPRVLDFMADVERQLWRLGIPAKTRHNEVAPAQFELAPLHEDLNLAVDHNMLVMEILRQTAERHGLLCLLHEKPFAGVNGSGKHNNWSISYGGRNLLDPGSDPSQNAIFLTVLCSIIRAVDKHADLLRTTTCGAGNDHRLGANEAPPAIISIFLGDQLAEVLSQLVSGAAGEAHAPGTLRVGVDTLPALPRDATDRNRTSPFAFTGNKFEFRAPGSSQCCAAANMFLNTIVADSFDYVSDRLEGVAPADFNATLQDLLRGILKAHSRVIFNGNGYAPEWAEEAARRGLPNLVSTPDALAPLLAPANQALVEKYGVFSAAEMASRHEIALEEYGKKIAIEGGIALEIAKSMILPAASEAYSAAAQALARAGKASLDAGSAALRKRAETLGNGLDSLSAGIDALEKAVAGGEPAPILDAMAAVRSAADSLEHEVDDALWPLPKYREMLFVY